MSEFPARHPGLCMPPRAPGGPEGQGSCRTRCLLRKRSQRIGPESLCPSAFLTGCRVRAGNTGTGSAGSLASPQTRSELTFPRALVPTATLLQTPSEGRAARQVLVGQENGFLSAFPPFPHARNGYLACLLRWQFGLRTFPRKCSEEIRCDYWGLCRPPQSHQARTPI